LSASAEAERDTPTPRKQLRGWRNALANAAVVLSSIVFTLLMIELVLRFLPIAWALAVEPPTAQHPIQRYVANTPFTWSFDWNLAPVVRGRSNAQGFLADYDYDAGASTPLVAVIGDSFIEALRVPFAESLTGRLQAMLGARGRAYAFAQSGSPLSQYIAYARHACATYRPHRLVVNVVGNDFDESVFENRRRDGIYHLYRRPDGGFDWKLTPLAPPGLAERIARRSALAIYLARNLNISGSIHWFKPTAANAANAAPPAFVGNTSADASPARIAEGVQVIDWFLAELPQAACLSPGEITIVVDAIRPIVFDTAAATAQASYFGQMRRSLLAQAATRGFVVVDMDPYFRAAYAAGQGPFEYPNDGHWNPRGHAVAAAAVREALADWPPLVPAWH
jgi:hypothetical protein